MDFSARIGHKIEVARRERNVSQTELAKRVNITQQCLSGYEHGRSQIPLKVFVSIAKALDAPVAWFLPELKQFGDIVSEEDLKFLHEVKQYTSPAIVSDFIKAVALKQTNVKKARSFATQQTSKVKPA